MKASIGFAGQSLIVTEGRGALLGSWKDQCLRAAAKSMPDGGAFAAAAAGTGAPIRIQVSRSAIDSAESGSLGGIWRFSSRYRTALIRRLSSGFPGTRA